MIGADNIILAIYNKFKYGLFYEMRRNGLEKCRFYDYREWNPDYGRFCFRTTNALENNSTCNIALIIDKFRYEYYDNLVDVFKSHANWLFEIGEYDYDTDTFDVIFKRSIYGGRIEEESYGVSNFGIIIRVRRDLYNKITDYMDADARCVYETYYTSLNVNHDFDLSSHLGGLDSLTDITINDMRKQLGLPALPTFKFDSPYGGRVPNLSKPPIFNPPATVCYWTDGTRTVVKCQEGDTYSKEAGLALCYMKKVLGNTSRDLNKELHKYIPEEKEEE